MRTDKLTSKFQMALADAQSLAVGRDHQFIDPLHVMLALLDQDSGTVRPLLAKAGANVNLLRSRIGEALDRLPKVEGTGGEVLVSNDLGKLLNLADKLAQDRDDQYISSELFLLAACGDKGTLGRILGEAGAVKGAIDKAIGEMRGGAKVDDPNAEETRQALEKYTDRSHRARGPGQARPDHRPRRRDPPHHPDPAAAHQEQPRADRRARRRQDRYRRRIGSTYRER